MKILNDSVCTKKKCGMLDLVPECADDIYELSKVITQNDVVKTFTHRKVSVDGKNQTKIGLNLCVKVESYSVDLHNGVMYIKGKVCEESEHVRQGLYHTLEIEVDKKFKLHKEVWTSENTKTIRDCTRQQQNILFCIMYDKDVVLSLVGRNRIKNINKLEYKNKKFTTVFNTTIAHVDKVETVVITSVTNACTDFYAHMVKNEDTLKKLKINIKDKFFVVKLGIEHKNRTNKQIINYIMTDKSVSKRFNTIKYVNDLREMNYYFVEFEKGNHDLLAGKTEIKKSLEQGALEKVFITDEIHKPADLVSRRKIESFCKTLTQYRIKMFIIPTDHHLGEKLKEIGGICGILKYNYRD